MSYSREIRIEFNHCDPAGIVFYPRYFEMANSVCENFFRDEVGMGYDAMMAAGHGVPTVHLDCDFRAPSRLGEVTEWRLAVTRLGETSVSFRLEVEGRLTIRITLVWLAADFRPRPWPDDMRAHLARHLETQDA